MTAPFPVWKKNMNPEIHRYFSKFMIQEREKKSEDFPITPSYAEPQKKNIPIKADKAVCL